MVIRLFSISSLRPMPKRPPARQLLGTECGGVIYFCDDLFREMDAGRIVSSITGIARVDSFIISQKMSIKMH